jgi:uncharacterized SAM-binding protein YcdF (DUF218 family)
VPPRGFRSGGRLRRYLLAALVALGAAGVYGFVNVGRWLSPQTPLEKADAIFVLAGTVAERPLEAADLYRDGYAPRILLTRDRPERAEGLAAARGVRLPGRVDMNRDLLLKLGVPGDAVIVPDRQHDNTASEAQTLRDVAISNGWRRVIVVTSVYHLRRAAIACHRALRGTDIEIVLRASRYDQAEPERWWTRRSDIRWVTSELPKVLAYTLRLGA